LVFSLTFLIFPFSPFFDKTFVKHHLIFELHFEALDFELLLRMDEVFSSQVKDFVAGYK
jgi:hypothetical protein